MRLIGHRDGLLVVGLLLALAVGFQPSIHFVLDVARQVEATYGVQLVPPLVILTGIFVFRQYEKRQESRAEATAAAAEAGQARARARDLEHLVTLGQALAKALTFDAIEQALWRHLPAFLDGHEAWVLLRAGDRWEPLLDTAGAASPDRWAALERIAANALTNDEATLARPEGIEHAGHTSFAMIVGGRLVGVLGVTPPPGPTARRALGASATLLAIAVRNVQLFLEVRHDSVRDDLTGCSTRAHATEVIELELRRCRRLGLPASMLMVDIDHFKSINDRLGHLVGDLALASVGKRLRHILRGTDVKCRYGGDEFLLLLPETPLEGALRVAEWVRQEIAAISLPAESAGSVSLTSSIGVATAPAAALEMEALIQLADQALYRAKQEGRNCVRSDTQPDAPSRAEDAVQLASCLQFPADWRVEPAETPRASTALAAGSV
ncbi:MAG TPA: diguanylate cyclase [Thermoleophilia bacterium]